MQLIFVEAHEDESRPQGGHAVIVIQGLASLPDKALFRLKPIDGRVPQGRLNGAKTIPLTPLAIRQTESTIELLAGPEVVSNPLLLAGTPVALEIVDADVRGEFLWPNVAPLKQPRRRKIAAAKKRPDETAGANGSAAHAETNGSGDLGLSMLEGFEQSKSAPQFAPSALAPTTFDKDPPAASGEDKNGASVADEAAGAASDSTSAAPEAPVSSSASQSNAALDEIFRPSLPETSRVQWYRPSDGKPGSRRGSPWPLLAAAAVALFGGYYAFLRGPEASLGAPKGLTEAAAPIAAVETPAPPPATPPATPPESPKSTTTAAALSPAMSAAKPPLACADPEITTTALDGGRMGLAIKAACHKNEDVRLAYGGATFVHRLDGNGKLDLVLDCFAGDAKPAELTFADNAPKSIPIVANDLARVSKVAILWQAPVNLDLHAFEYAALAGQRGHIFAGTPGSAAAALKETEAGPRGRGFMSTASDGKTSGDKVEVYTFFNRDDQTTGAVDFAIDDETRGDMPTAANCTGGAEAEVPYRVSLLIRGKVAGTEKGRIGAAACGAALSPAVRLARGALPVLKARK